jgi:hypothetical protein
MNLSLLELFFELAPLSREDVDELKLVGFLKKCAPLWGGRGGGGGGIFLSVLPLSRGDANELHLISFFLRVLFCLGRTLLS